MTLCRLRNSTLPACALRGLQGHVVTASQSKWQGHHRVSSGFIHGPATSAAGPWAAEGRPAGDPALLGLGGASRGLREQLLGNGVPTAGQEATAGPSGAQVPPPFPHLPPALHPSPALPRPKPPPRLHSEGSLRQSVLPRLQDSTVRRGPLCLGFLEQLVTFLSFFFFSGDSLS